MFNKTPDDVKMYFQLLREYVMQVGILMGVIAINLTFVVFTVMIMVKVITSFWTN